MNQISRRQVASKCTVPIESAKGIGLFDNAKRIEYPGDHSKITKDAGVYDILHKELVYCKEELQSPPSKKQPIEINIAG